MAIYRVTGEHPDTKEQETLLIRAATLNRALEFAHNRGLNKVDGEPANAQDAVNTPILSDTPDDQSESWLRGVAESSLIKRPVWTITKGVFLGLLIWALFAYAVYGILYLIFR